MGSVLTKGYTFGATEQVTATKLSALVDEGTIQNLAISTAMVAAGAITDAKVSDVTGSKFTTLTGIPAGAGVIPVANVPTMQSLTVSGNVPFGKYQITGVCLENRTDDPSAPGTGQIWLRTDL